MQDEYLRYGWYVAGFHRVLTARQMSDRRVIRWIKNESVRRAESEGISFSEWTERLEDYLRDAPIIFVRKRKRENEPGYEWIEAQLPTIRAFSCDRHWFEDFVRPVEMNKRARLPRRRAKLRVWLLGTMLRAMRNQERRQAQR